MHLMHVMKIKLCVVFKCKVVLKLLEQYYWTFVFNERVGEDLKGLVSIMGRLVILPCPRV